MKCASFRRWILAWLILIMVSGLSPLPDPAGATTGAPDPTVTIRPGAVLVKFKPGVATASEADLAAHYGATFQRTVINSVRLLRVPEGQEWAVSRALAAEPAVLYAEPDFLWQAVEPPMPAGV